MPPPPAAKAPSFVLSARTVIVPLSLSLFNFGAEREKPISKISTLFSLSFGENFSLSVRSKRIERSIRDYSLSLSPSSSYFSLSPAIVGRAAERAFSSSSSFVNVRRKMKSFLSPCVSSFLVRLSP
jgi:hypothetical protein